MNITAIGRKAAGLILASASLAFGWLMEPADLRAGEPPQPRAGTRPEENREVSVLPQTNARSAKPVCAVEVEDEVYGYEPADNGAGPMWCGGSTCLVRIGDVVFASGLETLKEAKPLNNCRWMLFRRDDHGWAKVAVDTEGRTREPSPLAGFSNGRLFLSANPTLVKDPQKYSGPARPEVLEYKATAFDAPVERWLPKWDGTPEFSEHSYRSFAADGANKELILFQNVGYTHAMWSFMDREKGWSASGKLTWPWGAEYDKPQPIRICYPNVALKDRAVYFCGVSDIIEPYQKWRDYKKKLTGRDWDYDFRRLFFTWTPDIASQAFQPWVEIASRDRTCGWIMPGDLWVAPNGVAHLLWTERAIDERLRGEFYPDVVQSHSLNYARVRDGELVLRQTLASTQGGRSREVASAGRFQVTPDRRLMVVYYVSGTNPEGKSVSENRIVEIAPDGQPGQPASLALKYPMNSFFTATVRGGSAPSHWIDLLGQRTSGGNKICYARLKLADR